MADPKKKKFALPQGATLAGEDNETPTQPTFKLPPGATLSPEMQGEMYAAANATKTDNISAPNFTAHIQLGKLLTQLGYQGVGAYIGGAAASALGPEATPFGVVGGRLLGGALGAMAGESARQNLSGEKMDIPAIVEAAPGGALQEAKAALEAADIGKVATKLRLLQEHPVVTTPEGKTFTLPRGISDTNRAAIEQGVPLTRGQYTGRVAMENVIRRSLGANPPFAELADAQNKALKQGAERIADALAPSITSLTPEEIGPAIENQVNAHLTTLGESVGAVGDVVRQRAGNFLIKFGSTPVEYKGTTTTIRNMAASLLRDMTVPGFERSTGNIESVSKARAILSDFLDTDKMTIDRAIQLKSLLFKISNSGEVDVGKGAISQMTHAVDSAVQNTLKKAGMGDLADQFAKVNANYRTAKDTAETAVVSALMKRAASKPDTVADLLLSRAADPTETVKQLEKLVGPQNMQNYSRSLWKRMFERTLQADDIVTPNLTKQFNSLGEPVQKALFGRDPETLAKMKRFVALVDRIGLTHQAVNGGEGTSLLAFGQAAGATELARGAFEAVFSADKSFGSFVLRGLGSGAVLVAPSAIARIMTRPAAIDVLNRALTTPTSTAAGRALAFRLFTMLESVSTQNQMQSKRR